MATLQGVPDPRERPVLEVWPETGKILGLGRSSTYEAVARGDIPSIRIGRKLLVPTAGLQRLLGLDEQESRPRESVG